MECELARIQMEKNQNCAQADALKSRELLELEHKSSLEGTH